MKKALSIAWDRENKGAVLTSEIVKLFSLFIEKHNRILTL